MAIEVIQMQGVHGTVEGYGCWYVINEKQQFFLLGAKDVHLETVVGSTEGVDAQPMGKLSEQNFILEQQLINSLRIDHWDFESYPDPEVILLTDNRQ